MVLTERSLKVIASIASLLSNSELETRSALLSYITSMAHNQFLSDTTVKSRNAN